MKKAPPSSRLDKMFDHLNDEPAAQAQPTPQPPSSVPPIDPVPSPAFLPESDRLERCSFLGLHDDPDTCLAYPSSWNYCYRARIPAPVLLSHQGEVCLKSAHEQCPVFLSTERRTMPSDLRGAAVNKSGQPARPQGAFLNRLLFALASTILLLVLLQFTPLSASLRFPAAAPVIPTATLRPSLTPLPSATQAESNAGIFALLTADALTQAAHPTSTPIQAPAGETATALPTSAPTGTPSRTATNTLAPITPATTVPAPAGTCGQSLDLPFGREWRFVIHRVIAGENLNVYAAAYQTTVESIMAINHHLPVPVWADWVVVIPLGLSDVNGLPSFEAYQSGVRPASLETLAAQFNVDLQALRRYNAFPDSCNTLSGWALMPRSQPDQ